MPSHLAWTKYATSMTGPSFALFQRELARFNHRRLQPELASSGWDSEIEDHCLVIKAEHEFVDALRREIAPLVADIPATVDGFIAWFEDLQQSGPGQGDALFPWLANTAGLEQMKWFVEQEVAGEAGFEDLLALT